MATADTDQRAPIGPRAVELLGQLGAGAEPDAASLALQLAYVLDRLDGIEAQQSEVLALAGRMVAGVERAADVLDAIRSGGLRSILTGSG